MQRREDERLLTGQGRFTDDIAMPGALHAAFVRSPHAHARIRSIETSVALALPGARLVLTATELAREGVGSMAVAPRLTDAEGLPPRPAPWPVLEGERVRHVGVAVAICVAETRRAALEMAETVAIDWEVLPAVTDVADALRAEAPQLHDRAPGNVSFRWALGNRAAVEKAFAAATHVVEVERVSQRIVVCPMEPRAAIANFAPASGTYHLHCGNQGMTILRDQLAQVLGIDKEGIVVTSGDVGGAFGIRNGTYPEYPALMVAARLLGRPVRWTGTRSEAFVSDAQARDSRMRGRLALDAQGQILALDVNAGAGMGGYMHPLGYFIATANFARCLPGPYRIPAVHAEIACVLTNTVPTAPYRGAGRPEAAYLTESLIEAAARKLGMDSIDLRRRNMLDREAIPHKTATGTTYDSGDFPGLLDQALRHADWAGAAARKVEAHARGRLRGIGLGIFVEISGGVPSERAKMALEAGGRITLRTALGATGQGHKTVFALIAAAELGVPPEQIEVADGDSRGFVDGGASSASRSTTMAGLAIRATSLALIEAARSRAARLLGVELAAVACSEGRFHVPGTNLAIGWDRLVEPGAPPITAEERIEAEPTFPNGCHVAEVEIDPETGAVEVIKYTAIDDCGRVIAHDLAEGQVHGALAQGIGQALLEHGAYDPASGQLLAGSFMDYTLPRADDLPLFDSHLSPSPARSNPLGVKGIGESGTTGALPAIANAITDALAPLGAGPVALPATPSRVWEAIRAARAK